MGKKEGKNNIKIMKKIRSSVCQGFPSCFDGAKIGKFLLRATHPLDFFQKKRKNVLRASRRQQSLLGGHHQLTSVIQVAVNVIGSVHDVHRAGHGANGHVRCFSLVMCSSLRASGVRLSSFRMCHFFIILTCYLSITCLLSLCFSMRPSVGQSRSLPPFPQRFVPP